MTEAIHYVVVGHFAKDIVPEGYRLGGAVCYSGIQAQKLGATVSLISSAASDIDLSEIKAAFNCHILDAPESTTFENIYDGEGNRVQNLRGRALDLLPADAPKLDPEPTLLQLGPLIAEVASNYGTAYPDARLCVTPQGWMRDVTAEGRVIPKKWEEAETVLAEAWACVFSEEDVGYDEGKIESLARMCKMSVCTRNYSAATLFYEGKRVEVPAYTANVVDPTGAGDVFAAAFFMRCYESGDPEDAVRFAHIAAARSIEGIGVDQICDREEILRLLGAG